MLLEMRSIQKRFFGVTVLDGVDFAVKPGRVIALSGENGAGKSTLMKIMGGIYTADGGEMRLRGAPVRFDSPDQAIAAGIAIIHQELSLLPAQSVAENIFLGFEPRNRLGLIDWPRLRAQARKVLTRLGQDIDPRLPVGRLSVAQQQMIEIARALSLNADVIVMDEPTDALSEAEVAILFSVIGQLRDQGKGVVFISHRLDEIFALCDEVVVLRDGRLVYDGSIGDLDEDRLIRHMVGRDIAERYPYVPADPGDRRLQLRGLHAPGVFGIDLELCAGEVVGLGGLVGAGRTELALALYGHAPITAGQMALDGRAVRFRDPGEAAAHGLVYVTEDRKHLGLVQELSVGANLMLGNLDRVSTGWGYVHRRRERATVTKAIRDFGIKTNSAQTAIRFLSGGNQQKVSLARALLRQPRVVVLDEPTRGVDVGAKREIYQRINQLKKAGMAVLLISSDLPELLGISDRVVVMRRGRIAGDFDHHEATQEKVMACAV